MSDIYYNHGHSPIFISISIRPDPLGGPGEMERKIIIEPGEGIDLSILNLKREPKPDSAIAKLKKYYTVSAYHHKLSTYVEVISDEFQSTFTVVDDNTLANMLGLTHDFELLTKIIRKYIPGAELDFIKTNQFDDAYDIYLVRLVE